MITETYIRKNGIPLGDNAKLLTLYYFRATNKHIPYLLYGLIKYNNKKYIVDTFGVEKIYKSFELDKYFEKYNAVILRDKTGNRTSYILYNGEGNQLNKGNTAEEVCRNIAKEKRYTYIERKDIKGFIAGLGVEYR